MSSVLLFGVSHGRTIPGQPIPERLMNKQSRKVFVARILPRITNDTILISEGHTGVSTRIDHDYVRKMIFIAPELTLGTVRPRIVGADRRYESTRKDHALELHTGRLQTFMNFGTCSRYPASFEELKLCIVNNELRHSFPSAASLDVRNSLRVYRKGQLEFDEQLVGKINRYAREDCVVIAGLLHCLRLHLTYGWELETPAGAGEWSKDLLEKTYAGYYLTYLCPLKFQE